ncbi:MAG: terpene utilization protein AtuA, partial [Halioglobus sp.]|nr:terpene utilization protein AtuA [Halioglobus sp.]
MGAPDYVDVCVEVVGDESHWGEAARYVRSREVAVKVACRHADRRATDLLMRELAGVGLGAPAGFCAFAGTRPKSAPARFDFSHQFKVGPVLESLARRTLVPSRAAST